MSREDVPDLAGELDGLLGARSELLSLRVDQLAPRDVIVSGGLRSRWRVLATAPSFSRPELVAVRLMGPSGPAVRYWPAVRRFGVERPVPSDAPARVL